MAHDWQPDFEQLVDDHQSMCFTLNSAAECAGSSFQVVVEAGVAVAVAISWLLSPPLMRQLDIRCNNYFAERSTRPPGRFEGIHPCPSKHPKLPSQLFKVRSVATYSTRRAITGLIEAARLAGTMLAISAQIASATTDPPSTRGSQLFTWYN